MSDVLVVSAKRKRGRPRKDGSISKRSPAKSLKTQEAGKHIPAKFINNNNDNAFLDHGMIGKVIHGVVEGTFDAGYLISVRVGNDKTLLRGIVFQPWKFIPITTANDVVPHMKIYQTSEVSNHVFDDCGQINSTSSRLEMTKNEMFMPFWQPSHNVLSNNNNFSYVVSENTGKTEASSTPQVYGSNIFQDEPKRLHFGFHQSNTENTHQSAFGFRNNEINGKSPPVEYHHELYMNQFKVEPNDYFNSPLQNMNLELDVTPIVRGKQQVLGDRDAYLETDHHLEEQHYDFVQEADPLLQHSYFIGEPVEFMLEKL